MLIFIGIIFVFALAVVYYSARRRKIDIWLPSYLAQLLVKRIKISRGTRPVHILFCMVDHFEPGNGGVGKETWEKRVDAWMERYPIIANQFVDADGCHPRHTWFYPPHYYNERLLKNLVSLCSRGYGEIEMHLHHNRMEPFPDTPETLRRKILKCLDDYSRLGIFKTSINRKPMIRYGFIHGDWALDNSRDNPSFCGINNEISILIETGCYADFTFPAYMMESQPRSANSLFYAVDNPTKRKSHDKGRVVEVGSVSNRGLMIIQGPLGVNWNERKKHIIPTIEDADVSSYHPPRPSRVDSWISAGIHVKNKPDWIVVKVHTHGAPETEHEILLGRPVEKMHEYLQAKYNDGFRYRLHYVTARELYNVIKAAENSETGDPGEYRNYVISEYLHIP